MFNLGIPLVLSMLNDSHYPILRRETEEIVVSLRADGIVHVFIKANTHITVEVQHRMLAAYKEITSVNRPFVFEPGEFTSISKEARNNAQFMEESSPVSASAIVIHNLGQRIIADYYYRFNRPKRPLAIFKSLDTAIEWLKKQEINPENKQVPPLGEGSNKRR